jgi:hypothetical protein
MKRINKRVGVFVTLIALGAAVQAGVIIGNLPLGTQLASNYGASQGFASGFLMGASGLVLDSVKLDVVTSDGLAPDVSIWSSTSLNQSTALPSSQIFNSFSYVQNGDNTWTATGSTPLAANTPYYVVVMATATQTGTWYRNTLAGGDAYAESGASYFNTRVNVGGWVPSGSPYYGMDVSAVPEPQQYAMLAGLGLLAFAAIRRKLATKIS